MKNNPTINLTSEDIKPLIDAAIEKTIILAQESEYDRSVCLKAAISSKNTVENVPLTGEWSQYVLTVITALETLRADYNDTDGEYTNGTAVIGTTIQEIYNLAQQLCQPPTKDE